MGVPEDQDHGPTLEANDLQKQEDEALRRKEDFQRLFYKTSDPNKFYIRRLKRAIRVAEPLLDTIIVNYRTMYKDSKGLAPVDYASYALSFEGPMAVIRRCFYTSHNWNSFDDPIAEYGKEIQLYIRLLKKAKEEVERDES